MFGRLLEVTSSFVASEFGLKRDEDACERCVLRRRNLSWRVASLSLMLVFIMIMMHPREFDI